MMVVEYRSGRTGAPRKRVSLHGLRGFKSHLHRFRRAGGVTRVYNRYRRRRLVRPMAPVWKTGLRETASRVQISPPPRWDSLTVAPRGKLDVSR